MGKKQHVTTLDEAMRALAKSWKSGRFDEIINILMGRPSVISEILGIKAVSNPFESEEDAIPGATLIAISIETHQQTVHISSEDLYDAAEQIKVMMALKRLADRGLMCLDYNRLDEHGFPCITADENQIEKMIAIRNQMGWNDQDET